MILSYDLINKIFDLYKVLLFQFVEAQSYYLINIAINAK